jgi:hypothetical protein
VGRKWQHPQAARQAQAAYQHQRELIRDYLAQGGRLIEPGRPGHKVRNADGRPLPCNWQDCVKDGDDRIQIAVPHPTPRWRLRKADGTVLQEQLIYIFCSEAHRAMFAKGTAFQRYV